MRNIFLFSLLVTCFSACTQPSKPSENNEPAASTSSSSEIKTGGAKMILVDGKYNVWTKKVGDGKIKIVAAWRSRIYP